MTERITIKMCEGKLKAVRELTGLNLKINHAYGGYNLYLEHKDTGWHDITYYRMNARELYYVLRSIYEVEIAKNAECVKQESA